MRIFSKVIPLILGIAISPSASARVHAFPTQAPYPGWLKHSWIIRKNLLGVGAKSFAWNGPPQLSLFLEANPPTATLEWEMTIPKNLRLTARDPDVTAELIGVEDVTERTRYRLRIPLTSLERPELQFFVVLPDGKVAQLSLRTQVRGDRVWVAQTESCSSLSLSLRESVQAPLPEKAWAGLAVLDCKADGSTVLATFFSNLLRQEGSPQETPQSPLTVQLPVLPGPDGILQKIELQYRHTGRPIQVFELHRGYLRSVNRKWFRHFELQGRFAFQQATLGYSITPVPRWTPTLFATEDWAFTAAIGASAYNISQAGGLAPFLEAELWARYRGIRPISFSLGGGMETWFGRGGTSAKAGTQVSWEFERPLLRFLERVYLGYNLQFMPGDFVHQFMGGIGIGF